MNGSHYRRNVNAHYARNARKQRAAGVSSRNKAGKLEILLKKAKQCVAKAKAKRIAKRKKHHAREITRKDCKKESNVWDANWQRSLDLVVANIVPNLRRKFRCCVCVRARLLLWVESSGHASNSFTRFVNLVLCLWACLAIGCVTDVIISVNRARTTSFWTPAICVGVICCVICSCFCPMRCDRWFCNGCCACVHHAFCSACEQIVNGWGWLIWIVAWALLGGSPWFTQCFAICGRV